MKTGMRLLLSFVLLSAALAACAPDAGTSTNPGYPAPRPTEAYPPPARTPGTTSASPTPIVLTPKSPKAAVGQSYDFELYTHCGIDFSVDFDAAFWDLTSPRTSDIGNPIQQGTMTLVDANLARFKYDKGTLDFKRHSGVKTIPGLCF